MGSLVGITGVYTHHGRPGRHIYTIIPTMGDLGGLYTLLYTHREARRRVYSVTHTGRLGSGYTPLYPPREAMGRVYTVIYPPREARRRVYPPIHTQGG